MIIRIFTAKVRPDKQADFKKILELLSLPEIQSKKGMIAFYPGQPLGQESNEFILVSVWKSEKGSETRSRDDWAKMVFPVEAFSLLEEWHVHGYRSFGVMEQPLKPLFQNI